jgi:hypothetical protein
MSLQSAARAFPPPATLWYPSSWRDLHRRANVNYSCIIEIQNDGDEPERLLGATIEGAGTGVLYKLTENNGHFTSRPFEEGLVINLCAHADRHGRTSPSLRALLVVAHPLDNAFAKAAAEPVAQRRSPHEADCRFGPLR